MTEKTLLGLLFCMWHVTKSYESSDVWQRFLAQLRYDRIIGRIANNQQQKRSLVVWPAKDSVQKAHGARCMSQRNQAGMVNGGNQHTGGDTDRLAHVVVLSFATVWQQTVALRKNDNQTRGDFQIWLVFICAHRGKSFQPFLWGSSMIELVLFFFGRFTNLLLDRRVLNHHKMPRL